MGVSHAAVHLPAHRLGTKALRSAGRARGYEALHVPWFDEDALTLAVDAGLALGDALDRAERIVLALDEASEQPGLAGIALDLDLPIVQVTGPNAGIDALATEGDEPTLLLAGGALQGGAGAALLLEPGAGIPVFEHASAQAGPLGSSRTDALTGAIGGLESDAPLRVPLGPVPGRQRPSEAEAAATARFGNAGAAGGLIELLAHLDDAGGPVRIASAAQGLGVAVTLGEGSLQVPGFEASATETTVDAVDQLSAKPAVPWSEASQGAYVSREAYDAEPRERYGARSLGPGTVAATTTIHAGPPGEFLRQHDAAGPYDVIIVELDREDRRVIGQATSPPGELLIGDRVEPVLRRLFSMEGQWRYAVKWRGPA